MGISSSMASARCWEPGAISIARRDGRDMEIAPGSQQRAEAMEEEMPIQLIPRPTPSSEPGGPRGERRASRRVPSVETWLIMEYCNSGTLRDAVERGWLRSPGISRPDSQKVLHVAWEVASGLTCLHNLGLAHGDLTPSNVLLSDSPDAPTGFIAKISDFGHGGACAGSSLQVAPRNAGRWTPSAPELMAHGILTQSADVYALGLLLIEMSTGEPPWGMETSFQKAMDLAVRNKVRPEIPSFLSRSVRSLLKKCLAWDADKRPPMHKVLKKLEQLKTASVTGKRGRGKFWRRLLGIAGFSRSQYNDETVSTTSGTTLATSLSGATSRSSTMRTRVRHRKPTIDRVSPGPQRKLMKRTG
ncbi:hypothetical protein WJX84_002590 [Apatococcus fuscideae]|uniref:Protein kinase domain-containing protein n=1 Tax=Apatococcus fuscideae TaxID=2026836 RepID=A0AAW1T5U3_9CHLO